MKYEKPCPWWAWFLPKLQSHNYHKARTRYARKDLRVSRQREEFCKRIALRLVKSNDLIAYEDLNVKGMVKNRHLAKSMTDAGWSTLRRWLDYFGYKYGKITIAVSPYNTSQNCSNCGKKVQKSLSTRTHICSCGFISDRDVNAAINILQKGLSTVGHTGSHKLGEFDPLASLVRQRGLGGFPPIPTPCGRGGPESPMSDCRTRKGAILRGKDWTVNQESPGFSRGECQ